ncbi:MAG: hypothetical protein KME64_19190 [Scytonematopsis contorta HA4267-MV1]|jgi:hypothetical protein|nr:hypothetical protein [Scytonematopsis contorta HA4267-MV1]
MNTSKTGFNFWFRFWILWLFPLPLLAVLPHLEYKTTKSFFILFTHIFGIGLIGGMGGLIFEDPHQKKNDSSNRNQGCGGALFWGIFWSIVYAIWFYYFVLPSATYGVNSYWGLLMIIIAPIILIYSSVGGLVGTNRRKSY